MKNLPPSVPVANFNSAEVKKADIPISGKDSADSKETDDGSSTKLNPFRKAKGIGTEVIYSATNLMRYVIELLGKRNFPT